MSRRDDFYHALRSSIDEQDTLVVLHSSLFVFRTHPVGLKWDLLSALRRLLADGLTLALPAVTFAFCRTGEYDYRTSTPETGLLVEWFLELPEVIRTPHPVYSFAVAGPLSAELARCRPDTAFGAGTVFEVFEREAARIVLFGGGWHSCTQLHRYEELAAVPYRHVKLCSGQADFGSGQTPVELRMFVRDLALQSQLNFAPVFDRLRAEGALLRSELFGAAIESVATPDLQRVAQDLLSRDGYALLHQPQVIRNRQRQLGREPIRLALSGSRNLDLLTSELVAVGQELLDGQPVQVYTSAYGQHVQDLLEPGSDLHRFRADAMFFTDRLEDVLGVDTLDDALAAERLPDAVRDYAELVSGYAASSERPVFVGSFAVLQPSLLRRGSAMVDSANSLLRQGLARHPQVHLLDTAEVLAGMVHGSAVDQRLWLVGRVPYSREFSRSLAEHYWGLALAALGRSARLIVVDLDNTLWGGVLGDEGIAGLQLGSDHPGNAHRRLQQALHTLRQRGVILAVCSKNDPDTALRAIRELSGMVLREDDFVALEIGWRPKWQAIEDIATSLNLGLEHVLFIDDNPVEREQVRQHLPEVRVLELGEDPSSYATALTRSPFITGLETTTDSDQRRTELYQARRAVAVERSRFVQLTDFYASLATVLRPDRLHEGNLARAEQLCLKTNQFNVTTRRHSRAELSRMAEDADSEVIVLGMSDRFSALEEVGLLVLRHDRVRSISSVETYLLSCRVLGRGLEVATLLWLAARLMAEGVRELRGEVIVTERNGPCQSVFADAGFVPGECQGQWRLPLDADLRPVPDWLKVLDSTDREAAKP